MSIDVCALNFLTESRESIELLRNRVEESPKILTDLLKLSLIYAPHLISKLLYGSKFQFSRHMSANDITAFYSRETLATGHSYILSAFDKVAKAATHAACSQFDLFGQTLSSIKLDDFLRIITDNVSLFFCPKESNQFLPIERSAKITVEDHRPTKFALLLSKMHPEFYVSALAELYKAGDLRKEDTVKFCTACYFDEIKKVFDNCETLRNPSLRFLLEKIVSSATFSNEYGKDLSCDLYIAAVIKMYLLEDSETVTKARQLDRRQTKVSRLPLKTEFFDQCVRSMIGDRNFEWVKILSPFYSIAKEMDCCKKSMCDLI